MMNLGLLGAMGSVGADLAQRFPGPSMMDKLGKLGGLMTATYQQQGQQQGLPVAPAGQAHVPQVAMPQMPGMVPGLIAPGGPQQLPPWLRAQRIPGLLGR